VCVCVCLRQEELVLKLHNLCVCVCVCVSVFAINTLRAAAAPYLPWLVAVVCLQAVEWLPLPLEGMVFSKRRSPTLKWNASSAVARCAASIRITAVNIEDSMAVGNHLADCCAGLQVRCKVLSVAIRSVRRPPAPHLPQHAPQTCINHTNKVGGNTQ